MSKILKNITLVIFPKTVNRPSQKRFKIWQNNGAEIQFDLLNATPNNSYVVINDKKKEYNRNELYRQLHISSDDEVLRFPIVKRSWVIDCLESGKLLSTTNYTFPLYDHLVTPESPQSPKSQKPPSKKRKTITISEYSDPSFSVDKKQRLILQLTWKREHSSSNNTPKIFANNLKIIEVFEDMIKLLNQGKMFDKSLSFKPKQYRKAVQTIENYQKTITSSLDLQGYPGIGQSISQHIDDIIETGTFPKYEELKKQFQENSEIKLISQLCKIHGFGEISAYKFVIKHKLKCFNDINIPDIFEDLNRVQKIGLEYYYDWIERIPRDEVTKHLELVKSVAKELDPDLEIRVMGSYLRGSRDCGDIDYLVFKEGVIEETEINEKLYQLVVKLKETGYIRCDLVSVSPDMDKFMGGGKLQSYDITRRIDIITAPYNSLGAAMIYFVGNDMFNRELRTLAHYNGWHLNDKALYKIIGEERIVIESFDEKRILDKLGVGWVKYEDRNI